MTTTQVDLLSIDNIITAWQKCPEAPDWPATIDAILVAEWRGQEIAWPQFEGESFAIFRTSDSTVVGEDELPPEAALSLAWKVILVPRAIDLSSLPDGLGPDGFNGRAPYCAMRGTEAVRAIAEIQAAMQFLARWAVPRKTRSLNSYALKHVIERGLGWYIPNGAAIVAADLLGYRVVPQRALAAKVAGEWAAEEEIGLRTSPNALIYVAVPDFDLDGALTGEWLPKGRRATR